MRSGPPAIGLPVAEAEYLAALVGELRAVLSDALLAVYPTGSLALNGYTPGRSDIDLIAVVEHAPRPVLADIVTRLAHDTLPCPAAGLEFVLYERAVLVTAGTGAGFALDLNTGRELPPKVSFGSDDQPAFWYPIDRAITYQQNVALVGPPPRESLVPVPFETLLPVVADSVDAHLRAVLDHGDNAVLNGCRALRFGLERRWDAKQVAAQWALETVPEFRALIAAAVASHRRGRVAGRTGSGDGAGAFLSFVLSRLREAQRVPDNRP